MPKAPEKVVTAAGVPVKVTARPPAVERAARERRNELMIYYVNRGWTAAKIAEEVGLTHRTVQTMLPKLLDKQTSRIAELAKREIVIQLGQVTHLYMEVYEQWEKSKEKRSEDIVKVEGEEESQEPENSKKPRKAAKITQTTTKIDGLGDPRYITELRALQDRKLKLLGLEKPESLAVVLQNITMNQWSVSGRTAQAVNQPVYTPAELEEIARTATDLGLGFNDAGQMINVRPALPAPEYLAAEEAEDVTIEGEFTDEAASRG